MARVREVLAEGVVEIWLTSEVRERGDRGALTVNFTRDRCCLSAICEIRTREPTAVTLA